MALEYGARVGKSVVNAYQRVINSKLSPRYLSRRWRIPVRFRASCPEHDWPVHLETNDKRRGVPDSEHPRDARAEPCRDHGGNLWVSDVLQRFEKMYEKNNPEKGGSFYLQSKIYFAKEHLMQDFPAELNKSQFNPNPEAADK